MIWMICFSLSVIFILIGFSVFMYMRNRGRDCARYLGAGVFAASVAVCFPVKLMDDSWPFALFMSVSHSIRMFVVDTGMSDITGELDPQMLGGLFYFYKTAVCLLYILAPIFTVGLVLRYFSNFFERFRLMAKSGQDLYIFSELNERSLSIARNIHKMVESRSGRAGIVFCKSSDKDDINVELEDSARRIQAVFLSREMDKVRPRAQKRSVSYFQVSENEEENVENTLHQIDRFTGVSYQKLSRRIDQEKISIYCYSTNAEAEVLIDARDKEELRVVLMDEVRDAVYEQITQHPLYANLNPVKAGEGREKICLLIAGGGKTGIEFLKAAAWCGQMNSFDLEIHMVDVKGNLILKKLRSECPELVSEGRNGNYDIHIHKGNIFSARMEKLLDGIDGISYCVSALGDDEDNIRAGIMLRKYFYMRGCAESPIICAYVRSDRKKRAVWEMYEKMRNKKRMYYNIIPFGNYGSNFGRQTEAAFLAEYMGLGVHFHYYNLDSGSTKKECQAALQGYYAKQGNRRSSIANGIHIPYKLWEMGLGILRVPQGGLEKQLYDTYITPVDFRKETEGRRQPFYDLEHVRWMAYERGEGWRLATKGSSNISDIRACYEEYCAQFANQNHLIKLHPALVPTSPTIPGEASLQEVDNMMQKVNREKGFGEYLPKYIQLDEELVDHIGEIIGGTWCRPEGIHVHGVRVQKGECVICRLGDAAAYYEALYRAYIEKQDQERISSEQILNLREGIKRCCYGVLRSDTGDSREMYRILAYIAEEEVLPDEAEKYRKMAE